MEFSFEFVDDNHTRELSSKSTAKNQSNADTVVTPPGCFMNSRFREFLPKIRDFRVYPDDTWVLSFPKCGTTWTQEMVWLLNNRLDYGTAKSVTLRDRFPFMELEAIMSVLEDDEIYPKTIDIAAEVPRPRHIKSHLPVQLLPKELWTVKPKIIYVAREPKDAMISYYHHHQLWNGYSGTLENFADAFLADRVVFAPYWDHVLDFWKIKDSENILFNTYEEMKKDLAGVVKKTAQFLEVGINEKQVAELCQHLSFKSMRDNNSVNYMKFANEIIKEIQVKDAEKLHFMRKGESGGWKNVLDKDTLDKFDEWNKRHLSGTGFDKYPWS